MFYLCLHWFPTTVQSKWELEPEWQCLMSDGLIQSVTVGKVHVDVCFSARHSTGNACVGWWKDWLKSTGKCLFVWHRPLISLTVQDDQHDLMTRWKKNITQRGNSLIVLHVQVSTATTNYSMPLKQMISGNIYEATPAHICNSHSSPTAPTAQLCWTFFSSPMIVPFHWTCPHTMRQWKRPLLL